MTRKKILLAGESWVTSATHYKGWDQFGSVTFHLGAEPLVAALKDSDFELVYMPSHEAATAFPLTIEGLQAYDAVILSDIGANTLLLHPDVWLTGKPVPNRLKLLRDWVRGGGGFMMIGGYYSFQGINGAARFHRTPVEDVLPVTCLPQDDRIEVPEGFAPEIVGPEDHPILQGLGRNWPLLLGANEVRPDEGADVEVLARLPEGDGGHPLLVTGRYGAGRTLVWTSDIGPHWVPNAFAEWPGYPKLWRQSLAWLTAGEK
ncbi:glutamine amidotransferase [Marinivivus vitaminiproducens]|uniref:glutamine amidotransferase n=1 Tax=Marinivivus vitaminiproducens TaxID=3035935 RepID=UPI00279D6B42|nr:glutamine amidotransferase [Geminicoccaceae bacterium SCSIO 64248]